MKTPVRRNVVERVDQLNDQLRFFSFAEYELLDRLNDFSPALQDRFTSDTFARNPYAPRIHVRLRDLPAFQDANRAFTFGAYVATAYEIVTTFFERAAQLAHACGVNMSSAGQRAPEVKYAENVEDLGWPPLDAGIVDLLSFVRLRRNSFVHVHSTPERAFVALTGRAGQLLNARWQRARGNVDFTIPRVGGFSEEEAIVLFKLLRVAVLGLDEHLAANLGENAIVYYLATERFGSESVRLNDAVLKIRVRKITSLARQEFGIVASPHVVEEVARRVGVR